MIIPVKTSQGSYDIVLERGALSQVKKLINLERRVLVVTDSGVPKEYSEAVLSACKEGYGFEFEMGEASKQMETLNELLSVLVQKGFTRTDAIVAVGGGVVGDLAGFAASIYMRGIDFYNIPTTLLSQVDSSIGGKTAIDFMGIKNIIGAFYPPKKVIIDPDTLKTLPTRQISNGLAEAVKMAATSSSELFELFEKTQPLENIDKIIELSLKIKKTVVEADEKEAGIRKILNFGHTIAHAVESNCGLKDIYHGEAVAIGMLYMCSNDVKERLESVLSRLKLPVKTDINTDELIYACRRDKKAQGEDITLVYVPEIGKYSLEKIPFSEFEKRLRGES